MQSNSSEEQEVMEDAVDDANEDEQEEGDAPQTNLQSNKKNKKKQESILNFIQTNPIYSGLAVGIPLSAGALVTMYYYQYFNSKHSKH